MSRKESIILLAAGSCAGIINGLFGAGGGLVLVPLLGLCVSFSEKDIFSTSIAIILPISLVSLVATGIPSTGIWKTALPYCIGSGIGGYLAVRFDHTIPTEWLHKILGVLILWGGIRYLC